jgi:lysine biosynthesis protein LysW
MLGSCPECDADIQVAEDVEKGERLRCPVCRAYLIVVGTRPVELDWVYLEDQLKLGDQEFEQ